MQLTAESKFRGGTQIQGAIEVFVVHHVVKGESGILTGGGQHLEKCAVGRVVGIPVAASIRITGAKPGFQHFGRRLPTSFGDERTCTLGEGTPRSPLENAPCQKIEFTGSRRIKNVNVVCTVGGDLNL